MINQRKLSIYVYLDYAVVVESLRMLGLTNFVRRNILKTKILHISIDRIWNYSWQNLTHIYKISNPAPHLLARTTTSMRLNLLTKTTWNFKAPGGILVFRVLVQVWLCTARRFAKTHTSTFFWQAYFRPVPLLFSLVELVEIIVPNLKYGPWLD